MNSALRALEQDGYIERRPHPASRRADSWSLTPAGLAELNRARRVGAAIFARMLATFNEKEITAFEDYLRRCIASLGNASPIVVQDPPRARAEKRWRRSAAG
jgi:DNA-binding MarR family transcriptional regulator